MRTLFLVSLFACKGTPTAVPVVDDDGDGFSTETDCDDGNPQVFPGAIDLAHDDVDADCNGEDGSEAFLKDLPLTIAGPAAGEGYGAAFVICDLTGDGQDDLVVLRPGSARLSRMHAFVGPLEAGELSTISSDFEIELDNEFVEEVFCEDLDDDGLDDLIAIRSPRGGSSGGPSIFYQPAGGFSADLTQDDAAKIDIPATIDDVAGVVIIGDFDGVGGPEILFARQSPTAVEDDLYLIPPGRYTGANLVADVGTVVATAWDSTNWLSRIDDIDGDGDPEIAACGSTAPFCRILPDVVGGDFDANVQHEITATVAGRFATGDFDGDGDVDDLAMKPFNGEIFNLQLDAFTQREIGMVTPDANQLRFPDSGNAWIQNVGDIDGDSIDDIGVAATGSTFAGTAQFRVFSGALSADPPGQGASSVALLSAMEGGAYVAGVASGDLDGDGLPDVLFGSATPEQDGVVGGWLSSGITHP